jgi:hypothetical protein
MSAKCSGDGESRYEDQDKDSRHEVGEEPATKGLYVDLLKRVAEVHSRLGRRGGREGGRGRGGRGREKFDIMDIL